MPPVLAAAIPAVIGAGTALYAGSQQRHAASQTLAAQQQATQQQLQLQREQFERAQTNLNPYMQAGQSALAPLQQQLRVGGQPQAPTQPAQTTQPGQPARTSVIGAQGMGGYTSPTLTSSGLPAQGPQAQTTQSPDYGAYLQQHPDIAEGYQAYTQGNATGFGGANEGQTWKDWGYGDNLSPEQFAQTYQEKTGQAAGYQIPTSTSTQTTQPDNGQTFTRPDALPAPNMQRPTDLQRPNDQRPGSLPVPTYARPDAPQFKDPGAISDFKFDPSTIMDDPGVAFRRKEALSAANQGFAARGLLQSGFAAKGVMDRASDLASQEYGNAFSRALQSYQSNANTQASNRNFSYNAFNNDRTFGNANFEADRTYGTNLYKDQQNRADNNFSNDRNFNDSQYRYGQDRADNQFGDDRSYNTNLWQYGNDNQTHGFESDRQYGAGREDNRTNNLFQLANVGANAAGGLNNAGSNFANNAGNIYGDQAGNIGANASARAGANASTFGAVAGAAGSLAGAYNWGGGSKAAPASNVGNTVNYGNSLNNVFAPRVF